MMRRKASGLKHLPKIKEENRALTKRGDEDN